MMDILVYNELDISSVHKQYDKVIDMLRRNDFYSAEVKKLSGTPYFRAKLDYTNRLIFKIITFNKKQYALILEIIHNHEYEKSRFLNGKKIDENQLKNIALEDLYQPEDEVTYLNPDNRYFHILDKIISFDAVQEDIFNFQPPMIIIGSAGSGKTMMTLEKMKACPGKVLYVTGSPYLVENALQLYYANHYANEYQEVEFLSYQEFIETIKVPATTELNFQKFSQWLRNAGEDKHIQDTNKIYEEFKGVITGNSIDNRYLSREQYINLGIKQSIYGVSERDKIYNLFEKYVAALKDKLHDTNIISFDYLDLAQEKYDFIVVDEIQDFTSIQLFLVLKTLKFKRQFILCGDSNQIVHPNFFSWAKIKSLFYHNETDSGNIIRIMNKNYRNSPNITSLANKILKIKNTRFGSIDKESHYLVESQSTTKGEVYCLLDDEVIQKEINEKTHKSTKFAVIVLRDDLKEQASQYFQTPLIFSIHEAKGLEYDNVILYKFLSSDTKKFSDIAQGVTHNDLDNEIIYSKVKDKTDRSLEIYKFFINALYVAITRAINNVYFIENIKQHPLLDLLSLQPTHEFIAVTEAESSLDEWQKEAQKLEMQGKKEQADAIRKNILHNQQLPWDVITPEYLIQLQDKAFNIEKPDKKSKLLLFEYAMNYDQPRIFKKLGEAGFSAALKAKKDYELLHRKYFIAYLSNNITPLMRQVTMYGIDFRNIFNQTPLMVACNFANISLAKHLMEKGANPALTDNIGRNSYQIILQQALLNKSFAKEKLLSFYECLNPSHLSLQADQQLIKLDVNRMEFLLVNLMIALANNKLQNHNLSWSFKVDDFLEPLTYFPEVIAAKRYIKRSYISSILAKHEVDKIDIYNKKLFLRIKRGFYILNPNLLLKQGDQWVNIYKLLDLEYLQKAVLSQKHGSTDIK